jgi:hypothetical protein
MKRRRSRGPIAAVRDMMRDVARAVLPRPRGTKAWELWTRDGYFVQAFTDKGEAQARARRLSRSNNHPRGYYMLKHRRSTARHHFGTRSRRRYAARGRY